MIFIVLLLLVQYVWKIKKDYLQSRRLFWPLSLMKSDKTNFCIKTRIIQDEVQKNRIGTCIEKHLQVMEKVSKVGRSIPFFTFLTYNPLILKSAISSSKLKAKYMFLSLFSNSSQWSTLSSVSCRFSPHHLLWQSCPLHPNHHCP